MAATFAILFGALIPAVVAASPAVGAPIVLCSGDGLRVVYDADGRPSPVQAPQTASLGCAMALLSDLAADGRAPVEGFVPPPPAPAAREGRPDRPLATVARPAPRPPSTAPPTA